MIKSCYLVHNNLTKEWYLGPMCAGDDELKYGISEQLKQRPDFPLYNFDYVKFGSLDVETGEFLPCEKVPVDLSALTK